LNRTPEPLTAFAIGKAESNTLAGMIDQLAGPLMTISMEYGDAPGYSGGIGSKKVPFLAASVELASNVV
jgi:hypothetical protein